MEKYKNLGGNSGVIQYAVAANSIEVEFNGGDAYLYTAESTGTEYVEEMKRLADQGRGLNTFINKHVEKHYAAKIRSGR
jgi:hypothetical protein